MTNERISNISWLETFQPDSDLLVEAFSEPNATVCAVLINRIQQDRIVFFSFASFSKKMILITYWMATQSRRHKTNIWIWFSKWARNFEIQKCEIILLRFGLWKRFFLSKCCVICNSNLGEIYLCWLNNERTKKKSPDITKFERQVNCFNFPLNLRSQMGVESKQAPTMRWINNKIFTENETISDF